MHVRGTPASGKSTLAIFLEQHVNSIFQGKGPVYRFRWTPGKFPLFISYNKLLNLFTEQIAPFDWIKKKAIIIVDEAQLSYDFKDLWHGSDKDIGVLCSSWPVHYCFCVVRIRHGSAATVWSLVYPVHFTSNQWKSTGPLTCNNLQVGLYLTRAKFDDLAPDSRTIIQSMARDFFLPSAEVLQYI